MRRFELKNIVDWFLKPPSEEKTPIVPTPSRTLHYTENLPTVPKMEESGSSGKGFFHRKSSEEKSTTESEEFSEKKPKMSILRKLCFLLSLNGGVAYVAAFLWFIPCQSPFCLQQQKDWTVNISGKLTSSLEATIPSPGELSSVLFGYSDENGGNLASFSITDGKMKWNKRTDQTLRHVFCNFDHLGAGNVPKCIVTAYNYVAAFDDSNGNLSWERNITEPDGEIIHKMGLSGNSKNGFHILGVSDAYLFVLDAKNGSVVDTFDLPCQWTVDVKLLGRLKKDSWVLVCEFGDSVEVWTFKEKDIQQKNTNSRNPKFKLLFKRGTDSASIDLAGDVTRIADSLVLSWADMVTMVTAQAPSRHPTKGWEVKEWGGKAPTVTSIISGNFTNSKEVQLAVAVQDEHNTTIHILNAINGTTVQKTNLGLRSVMSMEKVPGEEGETDLIIIESVIKVVAKNEDSSASQELPSTRSYYALQYSGKNTTFQNIVSKEVFKSILISHSKGVASLVIVCESSDGNKELKRFVITSKQQENACHWDTTHTKTTLLLD